MSFGENGFDVAIRTGWGSTRVNSLTEKVAWGSWEDVGGAFGEGILGHPAFAASQTGGKYVFMIGGLNKMWANIKEAGSEWWGGWIGLDGHWIVAAAANEREGKHIDVCSYDESPSLNTESPQYLNYCSMPLIRRCCRLVWTISRIEFQTIFCFPLLEMKI